MTCGVAKFNTELAKRLGVPFVGLYAEWGHRPLFSLKWSEVEPEDVCTLGKERRCERVGYSVFWHDSGDSFLTRGAQHVFYADPSLGSPGLWCPSLIAPRKKPVRLFSFGMAHKLQAEKYRRVRELLDAAGLPFHLRVSVGIHEGTSLSDATQHFDALKAIMGAENVTILGILSDEAVSEELTNAEYVLAFFEHGLRANNTTVHAALDYRRNVITNHDYETPTFLSKLTRDVECDWLARPFDYSWDALIEKMALVCEASKSAIAR